MVAFGVHANAINVRSRILIVSFPCVAAKTPAARAAPPTTMMANAFGATFQKLDECKSRVAPMMTNNSGAVKSDHNVVSAMLASRSASLHPWLVHSNASEAQNAMAISAPPPLTSKCVALYNITMTVDNTKLASRTPVLGFVDELNMFARTSALASAGPPTPPTTICVGTFHAIAVAPLPPPAATMPLQIPNPTMAIIPSKLDALIINAGTPCSTPNPRR
mmetsp:Transcript_7874/g.26405  ORF Transcript_7874/g.26405 Transcript_7874/m.26405 type:complete len:220 (+) Transcript_7874:1057-1716(+)